MPCCPLIRTFRQRDVQRDNDGERERIRIIDRLVTALSARLGWHKLERFLGAIPDSNDDFMIF